MGMVTVQVSAEEFPAQLKQLRKERELTQKQLADQAKISQQTISAIEKGKMDPSLKIVAAIAVVLGIVLMVGAFSSARSARNEISQTTTG